MGVVEETITLVLVEKHPNEDPSPCYTLEVYDKTPIFIPVEVMEDVVESFTQKLSEVSSPIGTDSAALQGWI